MAFLFENLEVYQKALDLTETIIHLTSEFPRGTHFISNQLNRAALSISLNIAEGNGRRHRLERRNFFWIARGSCHECVPILELFVRKKLVSPQQKTFLYQELENIAKMLAGLVKSTESV